MLTDLGLAIHNDDLGPVVGSFMDTAIYSHNQLDTDKRNDLTALRVVLRKESSIPAEVLPGELVCKDNIIRRITTAEAVGYDEFHNRPYEAPEYSHKVSIEEARKRAAEGACIIWRPEGTAPGVEQYALVVG